MHSSNRVLLAALLLIVAACRPEFQITNFQSNDALYRAGSEEFARGRWDNAVAAFEKLTTDLSPRDTLLPRAHWYLARAHQERGDWVLAATAFSRLAESFPDDTLADDAALEGARSYRRMWRKPALDPSYGESARLTYNTLLGLYPNSPLAPAAQRELAELEEMFAQKNYISGMYYFRRGGFDSGIIYFKEIVSRWPAGATARLAQLRLVESYKAIRYKEDAQETCALLRTRFPGDVEVVEVCKDVVAPVAPTTGSPAAPATPPPSSTGPPASAPVAPPAA